MRGLDRLLIGAALLLVAAVAADALRGHLHRGSRSASAPAPAETTPTAPRTATVPARSDALQAALREAPVPEDVHLLPSSTAFLERCPARSLSLRLGPGPRLVLRFAGPRCHVPPLRLNAVARDATGRVVYDGPALAHEDLSGNYAGSAVRSARLRLVCGPQPLSVQVSGSGLSAGGEVRCGPGGA